ncbi:MAG: hypothetical protein JWM44_637 [Bacilli bacterium]|nr:hypothetical protein [Bacilli bacterium]
MNILQSKKCWISLLTISLIMVSSVISGAGSTVHANAPGTASTHYHPKDDKQKPMPIIDEAASVLGISAEKLTQSLSGGKSLLDVAKEQGISEVDFSNKLLARRIMKVDEAVKAGKITKEKADHIKAKMQEHISFMITSKNLKELQARGHRKEHHHEANQTMSPERMAALIGISEDKFVEQLKSGKSIAEIAQTHGINKQQLISKIKDQLTPYLEKAIEYKGVSHATP